jgi:DNA-binding transcriptional MerR regulator
MEQQRMNWTPVGVLILAGILAFAFPGYAQTDSGTSDAGQETPEELLKTCRELVQMRNLGKALAYCNRVIDKGGTLASDAQELKKQILTRRNCEENYKSAMALSYRRLCPQAIEIRQKMQQSCSDFSGLDTLDTVLQSQCPAPQRPPELDEGIGLFKKRDYRGAQKVFEGLKATHPDLIELQTYLQNTEVEISVENCKAYLKHGDSGLASEQLKKLTELAPEDPRVDKLRAQLQLLSGSRQRDQGKNRGGADDALLAEAIHEFYAGHFSQADQMLDQYLGQPSKNKSLAYFFRGAIACTDYFLSGAKDEQKQTRAHDFFSKARQADAKFTPPRDYISPKIIDVYEKTAAGS